MNIFEEKTDSELLSYFSDYQKLCSLDKYLHTPQFRLGDHPAFQYRNGAKAAGFQCYCSHPCFPFSNLHLTEIIEDKSQSYYSFCTSATNARTS